MLQHFCIYPTEESEAKSVTLVFGFLFNTIIVTLVGTGAVLSGVEADLNVDILAMLVPLDITLAVISLCELLCKLRAFGFLYFRQFWDLLDFFGVMGSTFDLVDIALYTRPDRGLIIHSVVCVRSIRFVNGFVKWKGVKSDNSTVVLFYRTGVSMMYSFVYSVYFFTLLSSVGALVVTGYILPLIGSVRVPSGGSWTNVRPYLSSFPSSLLSMFEVMTLDNWSVNMSRPLVDSGYWFPVAILILLIVVGGFSYGSIIVGCAVDKSIEISTESNDRARAALDVRTERARKELLAHYQLCKSDDLAEISAGSFREWLLATPSAQAKLIELDIDENDISFIFRTMDSDNLGYIPFGGLATGMGRVKGDAKGQDLIHINSLLSKVHMQAEIVLDDMQKISTSAASCGDNLEELRSVVEAFRDRQGLNSSFRQRDIERGKNRREVIKAVRTMSESFASSQLD